MVSKSLYRQFGIVLFGILQVIVPAFALKFYSDTILPAYLRGTDLPLRSEYRFGLRTSDGCVFSSSIEVAASRQKSGTGHPLRPRDSVRRHLSQHLSLLTSGYPGRLHSRMVCIGSPPTGTSNRTLTAEWIVVRLCRALGLLMASLALALIGTGTAITSEQTPDVHEFGSAFLTNADTGQVLVLDLDVPSR